MSDWDRRKQVELVAKLTSLQSDLRMWSERTKAAQPLEKNHSQVLRIEADLGPVASMLATDAAAEGVADRWRTVERAVQDLLSVWGYFRDKLAIRLIEEYGSYLSTADDFAWACYLPAQRAAIAKGDIDKAAVHEAPLTCLDDVSSPFSLLRGTSYAGELGAANVATQTSRDLLRQLPVPVITLPWSQLEHLPDALIIAHEVGHHVLRDFQLEDAVTEAVSTAGDGDFPPGWAVETFCDVFATLNTGSAFAASLADFLRVAEVADDATDLYPPTATRLALCLAVLELDDIRSADEASSLRKRWADEGLDIDSARANPAVAKVAVAVATTPYASLGARLVDLDAFNTTKERATEEEAAELLAHRETQARDVRVLLAAAGAAFAKEPEKYRTMDVGAQVLEAAAQIRDPGVRWAGGEDAPPADVAQRAMPARAAVAGLGPDDEAQAIYARLMRSAVD